MSRWSVVSETITSHTHTHTQLCTADRLGLTGAGAGAAYRAQVSLPPALWHDLPRWNTTAVDFWLSVCSPSHQWQVRPLTHQLNVNLQKPRVRLLQLCWISVGSTSRHHHSSAIYRHSTSTHTQRENVMLRTSELV